MRSFLSIAAAIVAAGAGFAQSGPSRPRILGVAHIAVRTDNPDASRKFYHEQLGYDELPRPDGGPATFKVNDHQYIKVYPDWKGSEQVVLAQIAFETDDAARLRAYMAGKGVKVPAEAHKGPDGNLGFSIQDPDGHEVEFVQYLPGSLESRNFGKLMPPTRISERIIHVGTTTSNREAFDALYRDVLGFHEFWHGGSTDDRTDWVDMRVPDGTDWLEYMLNIRTPTQRTLGVMNHMALGVPSVDAGYKALMSRGLNPAQPPKIGRDGKWQLNLYDPTLTRAELMELAPVEKPCCSPMGK